MQKRGGMGGRGGERNVYVISRTYAVLSKSSKVGGGGGWSSHPEFFFFFFTISEIASLTTKIA